MKKVAVLIAALILAIAVGGCGSSDSTTEGGASSTPTAAASAQAPAPAPTVVDHTVPRKFTVNDDTPVFFQDALKKKQPIFLLFYAEDGNSQDILAEAKDVYNNKNYSGAADFMFLKENQNNDMVKLATQLGVNYIPYIAVFNRNEEIIFEKTGYVDSKILEQALYDAINK